MITLVLVDPYAPETPADAADREYRAAAELAKQACVEAGGHHWQIELEPIDPDWLYDATGPAELNCTACPAGVDDLYPDGFEMVGGEVQGIPINGGRHRSLLPLTCPVTVVVHVEHYPSNPAHGDEYDVWIEVAGVPS